MGQIISVAARAIRAAFTMCVRNISGYFRGLLRPAGTPRNEQNQSSDNDQQNSGESPIGKRSTILTEFCEDGAERVFYFYIYNSRQEQIANGLVYVDTSSSLDSTVMAYWYNPKIGATQELRLSYPIDFEVLKNLFS